jgi:hypothetical protein
MMNVASIAAKELPKLCHAVRRHIVHLDSKPTSLTSPDNSELLPFALRELQQTCVPPKELLFDNCFVKGGSEVLESTSPRANIQLACCVPD